MVQKGLKMHKKRQKIEFLDLKRRFFSLVELGGSILDLTTSHTALKLHLRAVKGVREHNFSHSEVLIPVGDYIVEFISRRRGESAVIEVSTESIKTVID